MTYIYIPYFDNGFHVLRADVARSRKVSGYWMHCGMIYGPYAYTTEEAAQCYIDKRYNEAKEYLYEEVTA